jgi:hypothetical protein
MGTSSMLTGDGIISKDNLVCMILDVCHDIVHYQKN